MFTRSCFRRDPIGTRCANFRFRSTVAVRFTSVLLLGALAIPAVLIRSPRTAASRNRFTPAPVSAPPEPFLIHSTSYRTEALASVISFGSRIVDRLKGPELPAGLENAKAPDRLESAYDAVASSLTAGKASTVAVPAPPSQPSSVVDFDFDNDGKADIGRWHSANTELKVRNSNGGSYATFTVGSSAARLAPGDFNGDGKTDAGTFNAGSWKYKTTTGGSEQTISWGTTGDIPVAGDYDGDGITDAAIYRPSTTTWWISKSSGGYTSTSFGLSGDIAVPGDYDGDGKNDLALFRPSTGDWHITGTTAGYYYTHWGIAIDTPVPADYDGDGKTDPAIFRPSTGTWYAYRSGLNNGSYYMQSWGNYADQPVPGDYDGDNRADYAIWRPTTGLWYILNSSDSSYASYALGVPGDTAVPSAYLKQVGGEVSGDALAAARLLPRNATGGTNLYSQNFSWGTSLVSLPGRAGLDAGIGISYNSLVWTKVGTSVVFDVDGSNAGPGFRLGLPVIEPIHYDTADSKNVWAYMLVTPSGGRAQFRQTVVSNIYETADSSYARLVTTGASNPNDPVEDVTIKVTTTDGTQMSYGWNAGAYRCSEIKDRNGNYISIAYDFIGRLDTMTDTLGRVVTVNYDGTTGLPTTITQSWNGTNGSGSGTTHTWATLSYTTKTTDIDFSGLAVVGPPDDTVMNVLDRITYPDGSSTKFDYNGYLQVQKVSSVAADSTSHVLNYVATNLASPGTSFTDCPRFTHTYTKIENFNMSGGSPQEIDVENLAPASSSFTGPNGSESTSMVKVTMAGHPDGLYTRLHFGPSGWKEGLSLAIEDCVGTNCSDRKRWSWSDWTEDTVGGVTPSYLLNPRVVETRVGDSSNTKRTTVSYYQPTSGSFPYGLPEEVKIYGTNLSTVLKTQKTTYNLSTNYTDRRIIGLPSETTLWEGTSSGTLMSKVTYGYDEAGYGGSGQSASSPTKHDASAYGTGFGYRGNPTSTTRWDVNYPTNSSLAATFSTRFNILGSPISFTDPRGRVTSLSYSDVWNDTTSRTTYAYPTGITDPGGYSSSIKYRFDIGANVWARSPTPSGSGNSYGKTTSRTYSDSTGRIAKEKIENGVSGAYTRYEYPYESPNATAALKTYSTIVDANGDTYINGSDEVLTETFSDGAGRPRMTRTINPDSFGGFTGRLTEYDILGRVKRETVPTEIDSSWNPAGDDDRGTSGGSYVWLWNSREYDWKGRVTREINTDGTDKLYSYDGCGCAGGQVTTIKGEITDAVDVAGSLQTTKRRTQKVYEDILGRAFKSEIWDLDGGGTAPYSTTKTTFNGRDQAILIRQYSGSDSSSTYQDTTFEFDGHGRMKKFHKPEQSDSSNNLTYTTYTFNADDSIATMTDPRGAVTTYKYGYIDEGTGTEYRPLLTKIVYTSPDTTNIPDPADVSFTYDPAGNRLSMSDGSGTLSYSYDELSRLTEETKTFDSTVLATPRSGGYVLQYAYHLTGGIKSIKDPHPTEGWEVKYASDKVGRMTGIGDSSGFGSQTSFATGIAFRAFGGVKSMAYSTAAQTNISLTYDSRLRPAAYEAESSANTSDIQNKTYTYTPDGSIKLSTNAIDEDYSQTYEYDFASRLKKNEVGVPASGLPGNRYKQTLGYDAFNHIASRSTFDDGTNRNFTAGYTNNRKSSGGYQNGSDTYDSAGNVVHNIISSLDWRNWKFDAAGRMTEWLEVSTYAGTTRHDQGETLTFDGDGQTVKRVKRSRVYASPPSGYMEIPEYYIYSSVTGQKVTELGGEQGLKTNIYMGSTVIAEYTSGGVAFKHTDPVTNSVMQTAPSGEVEAFDFGRIETEALGAVLATQPPETFEPPHSFSKGGSTSNPESGCQLNYAPIDCGHLIGFLRARGNPVLGGQIQSLWRYRRFLITPGNSQAEGSTVEDDTHLVNEWYEVHSTPLGNDVLVPLPTDFKEKLKERINSTQPGQTKSCNDFISEVIAKAIDNYNNVVGGESARANAAGQRNPPFVPRRADATSGVDLLEKIRKFTLSDNINLEGHGAGGTVKGSIRGGDAEVLIRSKSYSLPVARGFNPVQMWTNWYIGTAIHEMVHLGYAGITTDSALAQATYDLGYTKEKVLNVNTSNMTEIYKNSDTWNDALGRYCGTRW